MKPSSSQPLEAEHIVEGWLTSRSTMSVTVQSQSQQRTFWTKIHKELHYTGLYYSVKWQRDNSCYFWWELQQTDNSCYFGRELFWWNYSDENYVTRSGRLPRKPTNLTDYYLSWFYCIIRLILLRT